MIREGVVLGSVCTMDHEVRPFYKVFGPLTRYNLNVGQEECPCTKDECVDFLIYVEKG